MLRTSSAPESPRPLRTRSQSENVLEAARTVTQLTKDVTGFACVPIASQAAALMQSLLEVAKEVKDNEDACDRLAKSAETYFTRLRPFLVNSGNDPDALEKELYVFNEYLAEFLKDLQAMKKRSLVKRIWNKSRIATKLLDHEKALQTLYNTLILSLALDTNRLVRESEQNDHREEENVEYLDDVPKYSQAEIRLDGRVRSASAFFADAGFGEICSTGQRVIVKKVAHKTERDQDVKLWRKLWHANLPHLIGCSKSQSNTQFILFYDDMSLAASRTSQLRSLAAYVLDTFRTQDVFSIIDMLVDFVNDAVSAIRYMQVQLNLDEDQTAGLAKITKYTVGSNGRVIVTPPLQELNKLGYGVLSTIAWTLLPSSGESSASMRGYFAELDSVFPLTTFAEVFDVEQLAKWSLLYSIRTQVRFMSGGAEKPGQYLTPKSRWAWVDSLVNVKPGYFGILDPGKIREYAFRRVENPGTNNSSLFTYESSHRLYDRDEVDFEVVCEQPITWGLYQLPEECIIRHQHDQTLTLDIHEYDRSIQLSAPKSSEADELIFVVRSQHFHFYKHALGADEFVVSSEERRTTDIYAELQDVDQGGLRFSHYGPGHHPDSCDQSIDGQVRAEKYYEYMRIEYVTVPTEESATRLDVPKDAAVNDYDSECHQEGCAF